MFFHLKDDEIKVLAHKLYLLNRPRSLISECNLMPVFKVLVASDTSIREIAQHTVGKKNVYNLLTLLIPPRLMHAVFRSSAPCLSSQQ